MAMMEMTCSKAMMGTTLSSQARVTTPLKGALVPTRFGVTVGMNTDLAGVTQDLNARSFRTFEFFAIAAVLYYLIAKAVMLGARLLAWRLFRY